MNCGVNTGLVGFAAPDANNNWQGFDIDLCKAVAAAVLGDPDAVNYVPLTGKTRFTALAAGEIDMLSRNTTWTFSRDNDLINPRLNLHSGWRRPPRHPKAAPNL